MSDALTSNLDEACYSVRDFLVLATAAKAARKPLDAVIDGLLDLVADA